MLSLAPGPNGNTRRRAAKTPRYAGSDDIDAVAWYDGNAGGQTRPVGQKQPNAFGRHDMSGNVWEWTASDYQAEYDGRAMASSTNSQSGWVFVTRARRALRGGSWGTGPALARVAYRGWNDPASRFVLLGFRLARD